MPLGLRGFSSFSQGLLMACSIFLIRWAKMPLLGWGSAPCRAGTDVCTVGSGKAIHALHTPL